MSRTRTGSTRTNKDKERKREKDEGKDKYRDKYDDNVYYNNSSGD